MQVLRSRWLFSVRLAITLALVAYLVWHTGSELWQIRLRLVDYTQLGLALVCVVLAMVASAWLWQILIPPANRLPFRRLLASYLNGLFWNNFLPTGMGGDLVRALDLSSQSGQAEMAFGSVMMSRLASLWGVVVLAAGSAIYYGGSFGWKGGGVIVAVSMAALLVTVLVSAVLLGAPIPGRMRRRLGERFRMYASLRAFYHQPHLLLYALSLAVAIQLLAVAINTLVSGALGLSVSPTQLLFGMPLINLVVLLPVSIGGFGLREGSYMYMLGLVGVRPADAILLAIVVHLLLSCIAAAGAAGAALFFRPGAAPQ
jgi:glycosyltransferase 2 family protein